MNRDGRREMRGNASKRLAKAQAYVVVTFDGKGAPTYTYDVEKLQDKGDMRHALMRDVAFFVEGQVKALHYRANKNREEMEQAEKVNEAKEKRTEELSAVAE